MQKTPLFSLNICIEEQGWSSLGKRKVCPDTDKWDKYICRTEKFPFSYPFPEGIRYKQFPG